MPTLKSLNFEDGENNSTVAGILNSRSSCRSETEGLGQCNNSHAMEMAFVKTVIRYKLFQFQFNIKLVCQNCLKK
jgi:hypothetical protein